MTNKLSKAEMMRRLYNERKKAGLVVFKKHVTKAQKEKMDKFYESIK